MSLILFCKFCILVFFSVLLVVPGQQDLGEITYDGPPFVMVGGSFNITCRVFGELEWHKDGKPINAIRANGYVEPKQRQQGSFTISTLTVSGVKEAHAGAYKCNSLSNHYIYINVTRHNPQALAQYTDDTRSLGIYAPDYVVMNISNKTVELYCNSSNKQPDATFMWYHNGSLLNYTTDSCGKSAKYCYSKDKFIIKKININDTGTYKCVLGEDSKSFELYSIPHMSSKTLAHSYNKVEGDTISLNCTVDAYPEAVVFWNKSNGVLIETDRIKITNGTYFASLIIENLESDDRDVYHCIAINKYGSFSHDVLIRVKDKLAALWPFLGICAEVAILCTIIFIYEKRRSKEEMEEEEPTQEEKSVSNSNQKDKDIRQRK